MKFVPVLRQLALVAALVGAGVRANEGPAASARARVQLVPFGGADAAALGMGNVLATTLLEASEGRDDFELARPVAVPIPGEKKGPAPVPAALAAAREAISKHDFPRAEALLRQGIRAGLARDDVDFNDVLSARLLLAVSAFRAGDPARAEALLVEIFRVAPRFAPALEGRFPAVFRTAIQRAQRKGNAVPRGWLAVTGQPARVRLDGSPAGLLPFRAQVAEGKHWVQADDDRGGHYQAIVDVPRRGTSVHAELAPPATRARPEPLGSPVLDTALVAALRALCSAQHAPYALVGWVAPSSPGEGVVRVHAALFATARGDFSLLGAAPLDDPSLNFKTAATKLVVRLSQRLREPGPSPALPVSLAPGAAVPPPTPRPDAAGTAQDVPRRGPPTPVLAAAPEPSPPGTALAGSVPSGPAVQSASAPGFRLPWWAWVAGGAVAAGVGTYVVVSALHPSVTGTVSATY